MIKIWLDASKTVRAKQIVGQLNGDGTTVDFVCEEDPVEVRRYDASKTYGEVLTAGVDYNYDAATKTVTMTTAPATGETIVALVGDQFLFETQYVISNLADESQRTLEQQFWIEASGYNYYDLSISAMDLVSGAGADAAWYQFAPDNAGAPGTYASTATASQLLDGETLSFWAKCIVPQWTLPENHRDTAVQITARVESLN